jgi:hypothetical protein
MDFPEYRKINEQYAVFRLVKKWSVKVLTQIILELLTDKVVYNSLKDNCLTARTVFAWEEEEKNLLSIYKQFL